MTNATIEKFGYPETLVREYDHWVVLLRPAQVTLGSLVVAAKSDAEDFGDLSPAHFSELKKVAGEVSAMLRSAVDHEKLNWLMLMMVDPHVHFHVFPRYDGNREACGLNLADTSWPGPPNLKNARKLSAAEIQEFKHYFKSVLS